MKLLFGSLLALFSLFVLSEPTDDVIAAVRSGKAAEIVKLFDAKVSVKIIDQEDLLSRAQAEANLRFFFEKHPVKVFNATHRSSMNNGSHYVTGELETGNGKFRVSILIRQGVVTQFRIEADNE